MGVCGRSSTGLCIPKRLALTECYSWRVKSFMQMKENLFRVSGPRYRFAQWYLAPYRIAAKFFIGSTDLAEKVGDLELPRTFRNRHPSANWSFGCLLQLPFTILFYSVLGLFALLVVVMAVLWPLTLCIILEALNSLAT